MYEQTKKNNYYTNYFHSYIKYKLSKIRKNFDLGNYLKSRGEFQLLKSQYLSLILSQLKDTISIADFCDDTKDLWDQRFYDIIGNLNESITNLIYLSDHFVISTDYVPAIMKSTKYDSFKILNLAIIMMNIGCNFKLNGK